MAPGRIAAALTALAMIAACEPVDTPVAPLPVETPQPPPPRPEPPVVEPSEASRDLGLFYRRLQDDLLAQGLLRTDGGGIDTPYTATHLSRNFIRIALFDEYAPSTDGVLVPRQTPSVLRRWEVPIRVGVEFGAAVPEARRAEDRGAIARYVSRLSRITGHAMATMPEDANFHVLILNEDDRLGYEARLRQLVPGIADSSVRTFLNPGRSTLCLVIAFSDGSSPGYTRAVALIRAEHPDGLRLACIHEEIAQGLGLPNDSPQARPSIFNDDDEFALLTGHDENLLRILYDPRMRAGMPADEAAPLARTIAEELVGGES
ncbi:DUF2927 domain-containing protein [Wenxinia marina]|uniref:DUF2927 domain-containing protein n=1 Tax=Wenxinia marina DSM 24838 TaxID=1123501 RepID=A0A0D0NN54_9RHOB|nr:DUF2927 domain-containing protein [Wenxinia marina]KIQ69680.1 hypothetical protein Wenmar_02044 [Wenxinia marina DSM 24838]GGL60317.1 hypothetical protein GCM10011392_13510 [Wenxinia marina]